jgi:hypothetical protein
MQRKAFKMSYPFILQGSNVTVVIDGKPHTISKTHVTYQKVVDAIKAMDWPTVKNLIDPVKVVLNYGAGNISVKGDQLFWKGQPFAGVLASRMIQMLQDGFTIDPMVLFMHNLMKNPSKRSVDELYGFLEKNNLPLTPDGHFLAYKKVRRDFKDIHSGTMDNSPGTIVEMERNQVDDNKDQTCSTGLHFCGLSYLDHFGGIDSRVVIVKIDPADVVSIPSDYNGAKGRACRYEVIGEMGVKAEDAFTAPVQTNAHGTQSVYANKASKEDTTFAKRWNATQHVSSVNPEVRVGSSIHKRGYSDGFSGADYSNSYNYGSREHTAYDVGYDAGMADRENGDPERYRYEPKVVFNKMPPTNPNAWPFPSGNK